MTSKIKIDTVVFLLLFLVVAVVFVLMFEPFFEALILALAFSIIFRPVYRKILNKIGGRQNIASFLTTGLIFIIVLLPLTLLSFQLVNEAHNLYTKVSQEGSAEQSALQNITSELFNYINAYLPEFNLSFNEVATEVGQWIFNNLGNIFSSVLAIGIGLFIFAFSLFFLFRDSHQAISFFEKLSPLSPTQDKQVIERIRKTIYSVVVGDLLVALIQGALTGLAFFVAGIPQALLWGSLAAIVAIIPGLGPTLLLAPVGVYYIITGAVFKGVALILWGMLVVGLVDNFLRPFLIKRGIEIHPLLILISVLGGLSLFGAVGFLVGPIILSLFLALTGIYTNIVHQDKMAEKNS